MTAGDDKAWYAARRKLTRNGQALTKAEHDALTDGLGRALTDSPIRLRPGRDLIADATPTTQPKGN